MGGIARKVELYNLAFRLASEQIFKDRDVDGHAEIQKSEILKSEILKSLHDAIRHELHAGLDDAVAIAANAIRKLQDRRQGRLIGRGGAVGVD